MDLPHPQVHLDAGWQFPTPTIRHLDNGLSIWAFHLPGQYVVTAELVMDTALSDEPTGQEGIAALALGCADEGTLSHPHEALAEYIEDIGAAFDGVAGWWGTHASIQVAATHAQAGLRALYEVITEPAYDPTDVERQQALRLTGIEQSRIHPSALASAGMREIMWRPGSRQTIASGGSSTSVASITSDDVHAFHDRWWRPRGATLVLAGDFNDDLVDQAAQIFGAWASTDQTSSATRPEPSDERTPLMLIDRPGAVAADVRIGMVTPGRDDPSWAALQVATSVVGGMFGSRLNLDLREAKGYTYGVQSGLSAGRFSGNFQISSSFRNEIAAPACKRILELLNIERAPITPHETLDAIHYLVGIAPLRYDTADAIASQAAALASHRMSADWINRMHRAIATTDAAAATEAFDQLISSQLAKKLRFVVCGDASVLQPALEAEGFTVRSYTPSL